MTPSPPKVSIVTPVYNEEGHLAECIESVQRQTYSNWEYTIVDNCSTDSSAAIAQRYADADPRITVLRPPEFVSSFLNCNRALRSISADSKFCKIVLADDWIFPECVEKMVAVAERHPSVGLVGAYILEGDKVIATGLPYHVTCETGRDACRAHLLERRFIFGSQNAVLYRSDLVRAHDPFFDDSDPHADTQVCFALLKESDFGFVHQVLTYTRVRPGSLYAKALSLQTDLAVTLNLVSVYGDAFLTKTERTSLIEEHGAVYYAELGKNLLRRRGKAFWNYHASQLRKSPVGYSRLRVLTGLLRAGVAGVARRVRRGP